MNSIFSLSCLVFIIGSLLWTASAQGGHDFESDRTRVLSIYGNPRVHRVTKMRNIPIAVDFLEKYSDRIEMTPEQRSRTAIAVRSYKEELAKQELVEGAPPQGGIWSIIGMQILEAIIDIASHGFKKATKTEPLEKNKALEN